MLRGWFSVTVTPVVAVAALRGLCCCLQDMLVHVMDMSVQYCNDGLQESSVAGKCVFRSIKQPRREQGGTLSYTMHAYVCE